MAWAYVKNGGTCTTTGGRFSSAKTGSWSTAFSGATEYYNSIPDAFYYAQIGNGDIICVSDDHTVSISSHSNRAASYGTNFKIICVSNEDVTTPSTGAVENHNHTSDVLPDEGGRYCYGVSYYQQNTSGDIYLSSQKSTSDRYSNIIYEKCTFDGELTGSALHPSTLSVLDQKGAFIIGCTFKEGTTISASGINARPIFFACSFITASSSSYGNFLGTGGGYQSTTYMGPIELVQCDLSLSNRRLALSTGFANGKIIANLTKCKESTGANYSRSFNNIFTADTGLNVTWSSSTGLANHTFYQLRGSMDSVTSIYLDNGATLFPQDTNFSYKIATTASIQPNTYFKVLLCEFFYNPSISTTFTFEFCQENGSSAVTDRDMFIDLFYMPSSGYGAVRDTSRALPKINATDLTTSSASWSGISSPVKQKISITTSSAGRYGLVSVYLYFAKVSSTMYINPDPVIT